MLRNSSITNICLFGINISGINSKRFCMLLSPWLHFKKDGSTEYGCNNLHIYGNIRLIQDQNGTRKTNRHSHL